MINSLAPNINDPYVLTPLTFMLGVAEDWLTAYCSDWMWMTSVGKARMGRPPKSLDPSSYGNPYVNTEGFGDVTSLTGTRLAVLNADWVAATALDSCTSI